MSLIIKLSIQYKTYNLILLICNKKSNKYIVISNYLLKYVMSEVTSDKIESFKKKLQEIVNTTKVYFNKFNNLNKVDTIIISSVQVHTESGNKNLSHISALIASNDTRRIIITPFSSDHLKAIESALWETQLGNVTIQGKEIILKLHPVTEEYKMKLIKELKAKLESTKISIRNERQTQINNLKTIKSKEESESFKKQIQKIVDNSTTELEQAFKNLGY